MQPWPAPWPAMLERVVAVVPHPDDEVFLAGLLARAARAGASTTLICATRGEGGWVRGKRCPPDTVMSVRGPELAASCEAIGIERVVQLELPDGGVDAGNQGHRDALRAALDPDADLVLSYDRDGGYGHRDHLAVVEMLDELLIGRPVRWLRVAFPDGLFDDFVESIRRAQPDLLGPAQTGTRTPVTWSLDLDPELTDKKQRAARAHASQLGRDGVFLFRALESEIFTREMYRE